ncbi:hypothetical protein MIND_00474500 [Mycena indigotica]|uniref:Uncharacterized protein n=1 Tax=Mycena indigotica TaxID=2126181 RepID=A0A8H6W8E3_9AGAR|nr:uncharacterized protein MIND_00474500 [Mycena indigotica]KAF7306826.1 hypothetical protein MIND_00474500 [Mycena indigotica]
MSADNVHASLAANWDPEILEVYMAKTQQGEESDEAISSDESDSDVEFEEGPSLSAISEINIEPPSDIASDDSAFSSEDEFGEPESVRKQAMRRELALGRPGEEIMKMHLKDLAALHLSYMKQLDDADEEYAEMTDQPYVPIVRRAPVLGFDKPIARGPDLQEYILDLRKRSNKEVVGADSRKLFVEELVVLAQALFRRERQIKRLQNL